MNDIIPEGDFGFFNLSFRDEILNICFKNRLLDCMADFSCRDSFVDVVKQISKSTQLKVVVIEADFREAGCDAYTRFLQENAQTPDMMNIHRMFNMAKQLIMGIIRFDRIVIQVFRGEIISLFMNIGLACDYRIASDDTLFCNPYIDLGVISMGGGPYFLQKTVGPGKAWEVLLWEKSIPAWKAEELGLVDRVAEKGHLGEITTQIAGKFSRSDPETISGLKRLMGFNQKELLSYFATEEKEVFRIINRGSFFKNQ